MVMNQAAARPSDHLNYHERFHKVYVKTNNLSGQIGREESPGSAGYDAG